jgi:hypothetical protein
MALCLMKNYDPFESPRHFQLMDLLKSLTRTSMRRERTTASGAGPTIDVMKRRQDGGTSCSSRYVSRDLFNYDFGAAVHYSYATQEGEISFCAYNTGVGWRNIIEKMHMTATLTKWYEEHGRHEIFAGGKNVGMEKTEHELYLRDGIVTQEIQHDLDKLGIAKNSGEEKKRARDAKQRAADCGRSPWAAEERRSVRCAHGGAVSRSGAEENRSGSASFHSTRW